MLTKKHKYLIAAALIIAAIVIYKIFGDSATPAYQDIKVVDSAKAQLRSIDQTISLIGTIKSVNSSLLIAQENGILEIIAPAGSVVKKDQLIAKIINKNIDRHYELATAAEAIAKTQFESATRLFKTNAYSKYELEKSKNTLIAASKDLSDARIALAKLEFRAPFAGIIGVYKMQNLTQIQSGTSVVTLYDPDKIRVEFDVPISAVSLVNDGQNLGILSKQYKLTHIQKILDEAKHMSPAFCDIECKDCLIGSNAAVELTLIHKPQVIVIPFEAVFLRNGKLSVYVIKDMKAQVRNVELGIRNKNLVEIVSGLEVDEEYVKENPARLYPDVTVKIKE